MGRRLGLRDITIYHCYLSMCCLLFVHGQRFLDQGRELGRRNRRTYYLTYLHSSHDRDLTNTSLAVAAAANEEVPRKYRSRK